jgi:hypothetical protein
MHTHEYDDDAYDQDSSEEEWLCLFEDFYDIDIEDAELEAKRLLQLESKKREPSLDVVSEHGESPRAHKEFNSWSKYPSESLMSKPLYADGLA